MLDGRQLNHCCSWLSDKICFCLCVLQTAKDVVQSVVKEFGRLDILVNNASEQHVQKSLSDISPEQLQQTFQTNVFGYFYFAQVGWAAG
jgi:NAD(P)-dependent dehydrogenase (short-subunit alcohol dehydrogenase family)